MNRRTAFVGGAALAASTGAATYLTMSGMGSTSGYTANVDHLRVPLGSPANFRELVRFATLAPNGHNTQPWTFRERDNVIRIHPDYSRRTPIVDPDNHHLFVSLGCAAENLSLASLARGRPGVISFEPSDGGSLAFTHQAGPAISSALFDAIPGRQSTRAEYDGRHVSAADLRTLIAASSLPGVDVVLLTDWSSMERLRDLVVAGNSVQMADAAFMSELKSWVRFNPQRALRAGDGLYSVASGNPALPDWLGSYGFDWLMTPQSENDKYARQIRSSSGIAVFVASREGPEHWVAVGQSCQRFALQATAPGLKHAFINQPVEVAHLRPELAALVGLPGRRPDIVMRFGYGPTLPYSPRRPVDAVITV